MGQFRHLTNQEINEILTAYRGGEPKLSIARRFEIDNATVHYHIRKYEDAYILDGNVYALIKASVQHTCIHPSMQCAVCGVRRDTILRDERRQIAELKAQLAETQAQLDRARGIVE